MGWNEKNKKNGQKVQLRETQRFISLQCDTSFCFTFFAELQLFLSQSQILLFFYRTNWEMGLFITSAQLLNFSRQKK